MGYQPCWFSGLRNCLKTEKYIRTPIGKGNPFSLTQFGFSVFERKTKPHSHLKM